MAQKSLQSLASACFSSACLPLNPAHLTLRDTGVFYAFSFGYTLVYSIPYSSWNASSPPQNSYSSNQIWSPSWPPPQPRAHTSAPWPSWGHFHCSVHHLGMQQSVCRPICPHRPWVPGGRILSSSRTPPTRPVREGIDKQVLKKYFQAWKLLLLLWWRNTR